MTERSFRVRGLDCAEEVAILRRAVGPVVGGEENLRFDVLRGRMTVEKAPAGVGEEAVRRAVRDTGMEAVPWSETRREPEGFWQRRGRSVLCALSGLALCLGAAVHAFVAGGVLEAFRAEAPWTAIWIYAVSIVTGAWYVAPKAWFAARRLRPDMNLLMLLAVAGAIGLGEWLEAASVAFLFALALLLEQWSVGRARRAIESLLDLSPDLARVVDPETGQTEERPVEEVPLEAIVRVRPGDRVPLDGVVVSGATEIDQAPITGESVPVPKEPGDTVYAGTINGRGAIDVRVTRRPGETTLARILRRVEEARSRKADAEQWVDRFARVYTPVMMALAALMAVAPPLVAGGDWTVWFYRGLVLLVIACPCALVISTPVAVVAGLAAAARAGVLIQGGTFLEAPARLRAVAFDKTGTLTWGEPRVERVIPVHGHDEEEVLARAAALEADSSHPLARAILAEAAAQGVPVEPARDLASVPGKGATGRFDGRRYWIGSHRFLEEQGVETPELHRMAEEIEAAGTSVVAVGHESHVCGLIAVEDRLRDEAADTVAALHRQGIEWVEILTGDHATVALKVRDAVGADHVRSDLLPEDKVTAVEELRERYGKVAMVGDGINDAPALAVSSVGIAMGAAGSDAALETADVALLADDLGRLPWLLRHSRKTLGIIRTNVAFALGVKAVFIVLAGLGLATLWMAIAADMGASLLVIANSLRLLRGGS